MTKKEQYVLTRTEILYETENISIVEAAKIAAQEWEWKCFAEKNGKEIDHFIKTPGSVCRNCQFRKENYADIPNECKECGYLYARNHPYYGVIPSFKEN